MDSFLSFVEAGGVDVCRVVVQSARQVSDTVATRTGVRHESPQVLLLDGGNCVWHSSHRDITAAALREALAFCSRQEKS